MKKILFAVVVLVIAGLVGVLLGTTPAAEYIRSPYYRDALALEAEFEFVDILQLRVTDKNEIVMGLVFASDDATQAELASFTERLGEIFQKYIDEDTPLIAVWVVTKGRDGIFYANGLFMVEGEDLQTEGVTQDTLKPSQQVYMRWVMGEPVRFAEGTWPWIGR